MDHYNFGKEHILFLHAVKGCDTTSASFDKGKVKVLGKTIRKSSRPLKYNSSVHKRKLLRSRHFKT